MELWIESVVTGPETLFKRISNFRDMGVGLTNEKTHVTLFVWEDLDNTDGENLAQGLLCYSVEHLGVDATAFLTACSQALSATLRTAIARGQHVLFLNENDFLSQALHHYRQAEAKAKAEAEATAKAETAA